jgi:ATP-dependent DNA helicase RecQ
LDQLSTFGLRHHIKQDEVVLLVEKLLEAGLLEQTERERNRPLVQLTELGGQVMRGHVALEEDLGLPPLLIAKLRYAPRRSTGRADSSPTPTAPPKPVAPAPVPAVSPRPPQAPAEPHVGPVANVPANRGDLETRATKPPTTPVDRPLPHARVEREVTPSRTPAAPTQAESAAFDARSVEPPDAEFAARPIKPAFYWTWRLLRDGYSVAECQQIRGLDVGRLLDHALQAAEHNLPLDVAWFLTPAQTAELAAAIGDGAPPHLRPILERLAPGLTRQHVELFLRCRT